MQKYEEKQKKYNIGYITPSKRSDWNRLKFIELFDYLQNK
jgi:hypothetical protein